MANVADLNLIQIPEFPEVENPSEWIVVSDAEGTAYKISKENFKAFLGTVTVSAPKPIDPSNGTPELDGIYIPTVTQNEAGTDIVYTNAGGLMVNTAEGGEDYGNKVEFIKNGSEWVKSSYPLPMQDVSGLAEKSQLSELMLFSEQFKTVDNIITDQYGNLVSCNVVWVDGVTGLYTSADFNETHTVFDSYTITYGTKLLTQPKVTRDEFGNIIILPTKTIS